jgi:hypothetical protein
VSGRNHRNRQDSSNESGQRRTVRSCSAAGSVSGAGTGTRLEPGARHRSRLLRAPGQCLTPSATLVGGQASPERSCVRGAPVGTRARSGPSSGLDG